MGPGIVEGLILLKDMLPMFVPTKAHLGIIVMVKLLLSFLLAASVTLIINGPKAPATTGVPEITPVPAFNESPDGRLPDITDHVKGGLLPVHVKV